MTLDCLVAPLILWTTVLPFRFSLEEPPWTRGEVNIGSHVTLPRTMILAPSYSASHGLVDDRKVVLRLANRGTQRSEG